MPAFFPHSLLRPLLVLLALCLTPAASAQSAPDPAGIWRGTLDLGAAELRLELHVEAGDEGFSGYLVSVDQGGARIPADSIVLQDERLVARFPAISASYEAGFAAPDRLDGTFTQGAPRPLVLERGGEPFEAGFDPVREIGRDVDVTVASGDAVLAGSLRLPETEGPFPAFVLLTGTGPQDRNETIAGRPVFAALASALAERGIASLRLDDRGVGQSGGDFAAATPQVFADDAAAALAFLRARPEIDAGRAGLLGHSEGSVTAFLAAQTADPDFILTLAGMTSRADRVLFEQGEALVRAAGGGDAEVANTRAVQEEVIELARNTPLARLAEEIEAAMLARGQSEQMARANARTWGLPWFPALLEIDTPALIDAYDGPVAALYAENDLQVLPGPQSAVAREALADNPQARIEIVPGVNHLFQDSETGRMEEYQSAPHAMSPRALDAIGEAAADLVGVEN